ncbi:Hypothetical_protein [Hexamita inflata]|uniref:Hypothetical_protein n=1 Tax=Hexamita inflata TaxID=28002 RepID=A0AA86NNT3_9EUKA|nr:Hypothetical protein HINF_LOCUS10013 [Hexamita inflata]
MSVLMRRENTLIIEPGSDISKIQIINFILLPNSKKHFEGPPLQELVYRLLPANLQSTMEKLVNLDLSIFTIPDELQLESLNYMNVYCNFKLSKAYIITPDIYIPDPTNIRVELNTSISHQIHIKAPITTQKSMIMLIFESLTVQTFVFNPNKAKVLTFVSKICTSTTACYVMSFQMNNYMFFCLQVIQMLFETFTLFIELDFQQQRFQLLFTTRLFLHLMRLFTFNYLQTINIEEIMITYFEQLTLIFKEEIIILPEIILTNISKQMNINKVDTKTERKLIERNKYFLITKAEREIICLVLLV